MRKQKKQIVNKKHAIVRTMVLAAMAGLLVVPIGALRAVTTDELRRQSQELQAQINMNNARISELVAQAGTLKGKIAEYDAQIAYADAQISAINTKLEQLAIDLDNAQKELDRQKELLKASLTMLYKKGGASTVELLVGSDSFSQFINSQTYLERLKTGIQDSAEKVIALKQQIQEQQEEQKALLSQQQVIREGLALARSEREQLLIQTQGEESRYRQITKSLQDQQRKLISEIVARSRVLSGTGSGGYPAIWANAPQDSLIDDWGMFNRECVSFAAWKVASSGRWMPRNFPWTGGGNAKDWPMSAGMNGIPTGTTARIGSVAVWTGGGWGHVAYVEDVLPNGEIRISEYNAVPAYGGLYSERILSAKDPSLYIYF